MAVAPQRYQPHGLADRLWRHIRRRLGVAQTHDLLRQIRDSQKRMEGQMATAAEQLTTLSTKVDDLVSDVRAALDALAADRENFSPAGQEAFDALSAKVDSFDAEVGDADGSDTPAEPPTPDQP